jgi:diacylglycerol kinase (ATP)
LFLYERDLTKKKGERRQRDRRIKKIFVVGNPSAGGGSSARKWNSISRSIKERLGAKTVLSFVLAKKPGDATIATRKALETKADLVICIGGDGTANEVANGFFQKSRTLGKPRRLRQKAAMAFIPSGLETS